MGGSPKQVQTTNQSTKTNPWEPTIPTLNKVIGQVDNLAGNTGMTANETGAIDALTANAQAGNPYAAGVGGLASDLLGSGERSGMVRDAYGGLKDSLTPYANMETNPYQNEAFTKATGYMANDIMDRIKSQYAGAGYSPTGAGDFGQTVGEGISRGIAPTWLQAHNDMEGRKLGAIKGLYDAGNQTSGILSNYGQQGVGVAKSALEANNYGPAQMLAAEAARRGIPLDNLKGIQDLMIPMAQLGGSSNIQGTTTNETQIPKSQQIIGGATAAVGALSQMLPFIMSDRRVKEDVNEIGSLHDGTPVYSFNYIGNPKVHVGLMAQDVEQRRPDAVVEVAGVKMVDYGKATETAGILGRLK
jgi:hypothetical protein